VSYVDLDGPLNRAQPHIVKSVDGGMSWKPLDTTMVSGMVTSLLIDPVNTSTLYAGYHTLIDSSWGIARSTDGGASWTESDTGLPPGYNFLALAVDSITPSTLYTSYFDDATGIGGIFKSTDGGASWNGANAGPSIIDATALAIEPESPGALYAAAGHDGVFKSVDQGANWARLTALQNTAGSETVSLAIEFLDPNVLYAWTSEAGYCNYSDKLLFKSLNGGVNWSDSSSPPQNPCTFGGYLTLDPTDPKTLYISEFDYFDGGFWLQKTSDGGITGTSLWNRYDFGVDSLATDPTNNSTLYAGTMAGVFKSTDGGATWISPSQQFGVAALAIDPAYPSIVYAAANQPYPEAGSLSQFAGLFKSTDGGLTWSAMNNGLASLIDSGAPITALTISPDDTSIVYAATAGYGVFRSVDGGANWTPLNDGLTNLDVRLLALAPCVEHPLCGHHGWDVCDDGGSGDECPGELRGVIS
jgi:photosystem II stability/assembly factor-like uncharacterized protein